MFNLSHTHTWHKRQKKRTAKPTHVCSNPNMGIGDHLHNVGTHPARFLGRFLQGLFQASPLHVRRLSRSHSFVYTLGGQYFCCFTVHQGVGTVLGGMTCMNTKNTHLLSWHVFNYYWKSGKGKGMWCIINAKYLSIISDHFKKETLHFGLSFFDTHFGSVTPFSIPNLVLPHLTLSKPKKM